MSKLTLSRSDIPEPADLPALMQLHKKVFLTIAKEVKKTDHKVLDDTVHRLNEEAFELFDCLNCGNCCRSISPAITYAEVDNIAKKLRIKPSELVTRHIHMDTDGDFVFNSAPCPFIGHDNYCSVYTARPRACREYPHTDRKKFYQILDLSIKNAGVCPVVFAIMMKLGPSAQTNRQ
ncbi:MAG: YkgJ family cysteine cluster protein [Chloroflexota bacterium]|nr:YkgJ family cysteine cluster protein [Lentimicrobium sp.]